MLRETERRGNLWVVRVRARNINGSCNSYRRTSNGRKKISLGYFLRDQSVPTEVWGDGGERVETTATMRGRRRLGKSSEGKLWTRLLEDKAFPSGFSPLSPRSSRPLSFSPFYFSSAVSEILEKSSYSRGIPIPLPFLAFSLSFRNFLFLSLSFFLHASLIFSLLWKDAVDMPLTPFDAAIIMKNIHGFSSSRRQQLDFRQPRSDDTWNIVSELSGLIAKCSQVLFTRVYSVIIT